MFKKLNHIQICIPPNQEDKAKKFYIDILKLKEIEKPDILKKKGGFWLEAADIQLHISIEDMDPEKNSKRHPAFEVENLDELRKILVENNVKIREEDQISGQKRFSFFDPFNNRIEVLQFI